MKKVYILGAGASKADGLPIQAELLKNIFTMQDFKLNTELDFIQNEIPEFSEDIGNTYRQFEQCRRRLAIFVIECFGKAEQVKYAEAMHKYLTIVQPDLEAQEKMKEAWENFYREAAEIDVSLEDLFTILDKAVLEHRHFQSYSNGKMIEMRKDLQLCIIFILSCQMEQMESVFNYQKICQQLMKERLSVDYKEDNLAVITLNWDTILEQTLMKECEKWNSKHKDKQIIPDLCFYDYTFQEKEERIPSTLIKAKEYYNIKILKLHGSLNWLVCPKCGRTYVDYKKNIALKELQPLQNKEGHCRICSESDDILEHKPKLESIIITPTYLKEFNNTHLQNIWYNAYIDLTEADEIIFVGYSLPDADFELKNLIKRAVSRKMKISIVLTEKDNPDYYRRLLEAENLSEENIQSILSKMSFPKQHYDSLFSANEINYFYEGLEEYFKEDSHD